MSDRLEQLKKLHDVDPNDPFLTYGIALELSKDDLLEEAVTWLDKTIAIDADYCYAYTRKPKCLARWAKTNSSLKQSNKGSKLPSVPKMAKR